MYWMNKEILNVLKKEIRTEFGNVYSNFIYFEEGKYKKYYDLCLESVSDINQLNCFIFANEYHKIPPVKSFLLLQKEKLDLEDMMSDTKIKKGIGAFFGFVFKYARVIDGKPMYSTRVTRSIALKEFGVSTASMYE